MTPERHNIGPPEADVWTYSELSGYEESGGTLRGGLRFKLIGTDGLFGNLPIGLEVNPFYERTFGATREISYVPSGRQVLPGDQPSKTSYDVTRNTLGLQVMLTGAPARVVVRAPEPPPPPAPAVSAIAACVDFDDSTLTAKQNQWNAALYKNPTASPLELKDDVRKGLEDIGFSDADIASLRVEIATFNTFNGADGKTPNGVTRDVVLTIEDEVDKPGGGKEKVRLIVMDATGLMKAPPTALKHLEVGTLTDPNAGWIAENAKFIEVEKAKEAAQTAYKPDAFNFTVNYPTDRQITSAASTVNLPGFEKYIRDQGIFTSAAEFRKAKANVNALVVALNNPALADVDFYLQGTASRDGGDQGNYVLSTRRAAIIKIWLEKAGLKPRGALGTGEDNRFLASPRGTVATDRSVRVIFAKFPAGIIPTTVSTPVLSNTDFEAMATQVMAHGKSTEITFTTPGAAAVTRQVSPVKVQDRVMFLEMATPTNGTYQAGAPCAALAISARTLFYKDTLVPTVGTGTPVMITHTVEAPDKNYSGQPQPPRPAGTAE